MRTKLLIGLLLCLLLANVSVWQAVAVRADNHACIYFLNIGQGDAIFIDTGAHQIVVDGGPDDSVIRELSKILPAWDRTLDLVVLTHPQADHLTGLLAVLERYQVKEILATFADYDSALNGEWLKAVRLSGARLNYADASDDYYFDDVFVDTLFPVVVSTIPVSDVNEDSVILHISTDQTAALLMGDAGFAAEERLIKIYPQLSADILKVGHHGSKYSSSAEFLGYLHPASAVISVGKNSYGHPSPDTLNSLNRVGAKIYRTDQSGTIKFAL